MKELLMCRLSTQDVISIVTASISLVAMAISCIALILTCRHFRSNMKKQEQSIALSLLDRRLDVLNYFENVQYTYEDAIEGIVTGKHVMVEQFYMLFSDKLISEYKSIQDFRDKDINEVSLKLKNIELKFLTTPQNATAEEREEIAHKEATLREYRERAFVIGATLTDKNEFRAYASKILGGTDEYYNLTVQFVEMNHKLDQKEKEFKQNLSDEIRLSIRS